MPLLLNAALRRILIACAMAWQASASATPAVDNSALDGSLLFQLLTAEMELRSGDFNAGYAKLLDAARRTRDDELFKRAAVLALARSTSDQALAAVRVWRQTKPESLDALQFELQILAMRSRAQGVADIAAPLSTLIARTPAAERSGTIAGTAGLLRRLPASADTAQMMEVVLKPYAAPGPTRIAALVAMARGWLHAGDAAKAMPLLQSAAQSDPAAIGPALVALELLDKPAHSAAAEGILQGYLAQPGAAAAARQAYAQALTQTQRYSDALTQLRVLTQNQPEQTRAWLTRGALEVELRQPRDAERSLQQFLKVLDTAADPDSNSADEEELGSSKAAQRTQALLLLSQAAQLRGDLTQAGLWLDQIGPVNGSLEVALRRALVWAAGGKLREARALLAALPENEDVTAKAKTLAESQVLRESKRYGDALTLLTTASTQQPDDADLLYERAMLAEKLKRHEEVEQLLRRVINLQPSHHHAHNALGYALAERNVRLSEARALIEKALSLAPNDPFITDSMGWVEFRLGNVDAALGHLRRAYAQRPDTEIAAHLGEVLWAKGQREEAERIWREAREREADNEVLRDTLKRLQVRL
jgi:tetratricopeptide (TPR) repeat protein